MAWKRISHLRFVGIYAFGNGSIGLIGIALTALLGWLLGSDGFGALASLVALQNIWAALGFMRVETRLATSSNEVEADKILLAGFMAGGLITVALSLSVGLVWGWRSQYTLVFISGFALSVFDALAVRHAFSSHQRSVIGVRAVRILGPLLCCLLVTFWSRHPDEVFLWQSLGMLCLSLAMWRRWIGFKRWFCVCSEVLLRNWRGLLPSLAFCLLNGIWLNGLTPYLNAYFSSAQAGQFAMLQRVLGGCLGLVSTATAMVFAQSDHVRPSLIQVQRVFLVNLVCSVGFCLFAAIAFLGGWVNWILGNGWTYEINMFVSVSLFLTFSYSVGAITALASRLRDEWFLTIWQAVALLICAALLLISPVDRNVLYALNLGALMYMLLGLRWYFLLKKCT
jgi:hypothetical protein